MGKQTIWQKVRGNKVFWVVIAGLVLFASGYLMGRNHKLPAEVVERIVEDTVTKQKLEEAKTIIVQLQRQIETEQNKVAELKAHIKTHTIIVKNTDGSSTTTTTTETDLEKKINENTKISDKTETKTDTKETKTSESDTKNHKETEKITTPLVRDDFYLGLSAQVGTNGVTRPGVEFKYRLIDLKKISGWIGTEVIAPTTFKFSDAELRLNLGVSL